MPSSVELCRRIFFSFSLCRFADTSSAGNFPIARRYPILLGIKAIFLAVVLGEIEQYVSIDG
jgi:hypothetical protein